MSAWIALAADATSAALQAAEALPADPRREVILGPLRGAADLLAGAASVRVEAVQAALQAAMQAVVVQAAGGYAGIEIVALVAAAFNAVAPERSYRLDAVLARAGASEQVLLATRGMPALKASTRTPFVRPTADLGPAADEAPVEESAPEPTLAVAEDEIANDNEGELVGSLFADVPAVDWRETEGTKPEPPLVSWKDGGAAAPTECFYGMVADEALDALLAYGRDRSLAPLEEREDAERRALHQVDALAAIGDRVVERILDWWSRALAVPGPWCSWAAACALGCLEGPDALAALAVGLERLPQEAVAHAALAAEALAVAPHPDRTALGWDLVTSPHPVARAVGVDVLCRAGQLPPAELRRYLLDASVPVLASAVQAVARMTVEEAGPLVPLIERWMRFPHRDVAWPAARALLLWGREEPYEDVRSGGQLARVLGVRAAEVLVLAGDAGDLGRMQAILSAAPPSRRTLSTLARFGHPGAWAYLTHQLGNEDLVDDAAEALAVLFGGLVAWEERRSMSAWRAAIAGARLDAGLRYRRGEAWRPGVVAAECESIGLSRHDVELRVDELAARARVGARVDAGAWWPTARAALVEIATRARRADATTRAGAWRV